MRKKLLLIGTGLSPNDCVERIPAESGLRHCVLVAVNYSTCVVTPKRFVEDYRPNFEESIDAFLRLFENIYPQEKIAAHIEDGID